MEVELRVRASGALGVEYALRRSSPRVSPSLMSRVASGVAAAVLTTAGWALALAVALGSFWNEQTQAAAVAAALAFVLAVTTFISGRAVVEEALLVLPSLGVQLRKTRRNGTTTSKFVDARAICAVVIHEAITFADVPYLLAFMVDGQEDSMLLAFEEFRPRIGVLKEIYSGTKRILFPDDGAGGDVASSREETTGDSLPSARVMRLPQRLQAALDER